jgi:hypothetical protein
MKSVRETMDIIAAYHEVGSYRGAAAMCNTTHRTVRRAVLQREGTRIPQPRGPPSAGGTTTSSPASWRPR